jgi:hypothetical protein
MRAARLGPTAWALVTILLGIGAYALLRSLRAELVDFEVYRRAAARVLAVEPLFRLDDGHFQFKYLPAFALVMVSFAWLPKMPAEGLWFALSVGASAWFVRLSLRELPDRRIEDDRLIWLGLLLAGKFLVKELAFGQSNLLFGIVLMGAALAVGRRRHVAAGLLVGAGLFIKPYAVVFLPWLVWVSGPVGLGGFVGAAAFGLIMPAAVYGWAGNLELLAGWYRVVTASTAHTLLSHDNVSFASIWTKWMGSSGVPVGLTVASCAAALAGAFSALTVRRRVRAPEYLEYALFALLVPLVSPQGWDYVLLLGLPGFLLLVDRWRETPWPWRLLMLVGFAVTSFGIYDLMRRPLYMFVMKNGIPTLGALALFACLLRLRWRALA